MDDERLTLSQQLHEAAEGDDVDNIRALLTAGADINGAGVREQEGWTVLHEAAVNGHANVVRVALRAGCDVNAVELDEGSTPLMWAAHNGDRDAIGVLISAGARLDARDIWGTTPFDYADDVARLQMLAAGYTCPLWFLLMPGKHLLLAEAAWAKRASLVALREHHLSVD